MKLGARGGDAPSARPQYATSALVSLAAWLVGAQGFIIADLGAFLVFVRPPLLAEDPASLRGRAMGGRPHSLSGMTETGKGRLRNRKVKIPVSSLTGIPRAVS